MKLVVTTALCLARPFPEMSHQTGCMHHERRRRLRRGGQLDSRFVGPGSFAPISSTSRRRRLPPTRQGARKNIAPSSGVRRRRWGGPSPSPDQLRAPGCNHQRLSRPPASRRCRRGRGGHWFRHHSRHIVKLQLILPDAAHKVQRVDGPEGGGIINNQPSGRKGKWGLATEES